MTRETKANYRPINTKKENIFRFFQVVVTIFICFNILSCKKESTSYQTIETPHPIKDRLGNPRQYRLYLPAFRDTPFPLLVYFHGVISREFAKIPTLAGYTGSPVEETGLIDFCRRRGIALLVPEAFYQYPFLNCPAKGWLAEKEMDGVEKIIAAVCRHYPIAVDEVFLAGISAGAVFCHFLANHRPSAYSAILSHSQGYMDQDNRPLPPGDKIPRFGVLFAYTRGDYPQLKKHCIESEAVYHKWGYRTHILADLPPDSHRWANTHNPIFWRWLNRLAASD